MISVTGSIPFVLEELRELLTEAPCIHRQEWQAMDTKASDAHTTYELPHVMLEMPVPASESTLLDEVEPDMPWAENQFNERVAGEPVNPGKTYAEWPHHKGDATRHHEQGQFSHTYMERYWPRGAAGGRPPITYSGIDPETGELRGGFINRPHHGVRYQYGDLNNLVHMLGERPLTRQAYLPVWFPEDLWAADIEHERVPCTLGYHFLVVSDRLRGEVLHVMYPIRSCDYVRHLRNDIYMTARLLQWVVSQLKSRHDLYLDPGNIVMNIGSLHVFYGDRKEIGL